MCYKAPGPRCSAHAKKKLIETTTYLKTLSVFRDSPEVYGQAKQAVADAEMDYDSTPAGQKYLKLRIEQGMDRSGEYAERLVNAKKLRRMQLKAIDSKEAGDINNHSQISRDWNDDGINEHDTVRKGWDTHPDGVDAKIAQYETISLSAAQVLSADEQSALYWVTSDGGPFINSKLTGKVNHKDAETGEWTWEKTSQPYQREGYTKEFTQKKIRHLNSAFRKYSLEKNAILGACLTSYSPLTPIRRQSISTCTKNTL
jgi:hypothetical protein